MNKAYIDRKDEVKRVERAASDFQLCLRQCGGYATDWLVVLRFVN